MKEKAIEAGALGCGISGSGPTLFALSTEMETARKVGEVIQHQFSSFELQSDVFVSRVNQKGACILN
jgi:homoserine kinase